MGIIIDIVLIAIVVFGAVQGYRKGFVEIMEKMLYLVVVGALAMTLKPLGVSIIERTSIPELISTKAQQIITENIGDKISQVGSEEQLTNLLAENTLPESVAQMLTEKLGQAEQFLAQDKTELIASIADAFADFVVGAIAVVALFILLSIAYFLLFRIIGLVFKLPLLKQVDQILGVVGGLISSLITVAIIICICTVIAPFSTEFNGILASSFVYGFCVKII
ncbi:MAG: CvpA family protein [Clostridia bacterium]|nr:CvpA family protein [Clostridia bacterium]